MASFKSSPSSSSSSSVPTGRCTYDVFLSFRGDDTRYTFVDHLYAALHQRGIRAFKDDEELHRGKPISPELLKAIEESRFAVVVFSKNYANSSWCLEELVKIMECQALRVLPVFYHVDPSDIRGLKRDFATAFEQHHQKFGGETDKLNKWKKALAAAANLSGWHIMETGHGGEYAFIDKIVQEILGDMRSRGMENNLIGIDSHINAINSLLDTEATEEVRFIGIWGMGGLGKTTIAQGLFKRISNKFEGHSFVKDVRENSCSKNYICALQEKILREILMTRQGFMIQDPEYGAETIRERLCNKKVLLVLDDVDNVKQLEYLAATHEWFGPGSRIIITTRDYHVLSNANFKYQPSLLRMDQALELFSMHAFQKNSPPEGYEEVSSRAIQYTGCLPLALKVIGSFFHGRQLCVWESALNRLAKTTDKDIFETLKISFDGLDESEKKILLDIACFFKGNHEERVTRILDSFGFDPVIGISILIEKSLITISYNELQMHDLIQEMSWKIIRESYPNSRMWKLEDVNDFVKRNRKLKAIEAIVVPYMIKEISCSGDVFDSMENLRLLHVREKFTSSEPTFLPHELRWLRWDNYPFYSLPLANSCKLVGLEMFGGKMEELWKGRKVMSHLKFIRLYYLGCLEKFPDVSGAPYIERLDLEHCINFPKDFQSLTSLEELYLTGNHVLIELPASISHLSCLKYLNLDECRQLQSLHGLPSGIQVLKANNCTSLEKIEDLSQEYEWLHKIWLVRCEKLVEDQENERYLDKMLQKSFLEKCASVDHRLSIAIPSSKIPRWFVDQQDGENITLKLPPNWHSRIKGFAICTLFSGVPGIIHVSPRIYFTFKNNGDLISESKVERINASTTTMDDNVVWLSYIPIKYFQRINHNWAHINEAGNLVIHVLVKGHVPSVLRCGAHVVYKEDVETCVSVHDDYWNTKDCVTQHGHTFLYQEKIGGAYDRL